MAEWKRPLLIGVGWGLGTAVGLALVVGGFLWYQSRPKPPKPWNTAALAIKEPPSFHSADHEHLEFTYSIQNTTNSDYQIVSDEKVKVVARYKDGTLSTPLSTEVRHLELPVFIPANQKGQLTFSVGLTGIPERKASESDEQYHERLRVYCEAHLENVANFVLFDDANRYEIDLPRWLAENPKKSAAEGRTQR